MTWFALQSLFLILGAFVLGVLVGWLVWGRQERQERIVVLHGDTTAPQAATRRQPAPAAAGAGVTGAGSRATPPPGVAAADHEPHWLHARPAEQPAPATGAAGGSLAGTGPAAGEPGSTTPDVVDLREPAPDVVDLRDEPATGGTTDGAATDGARPAGTDTARPGEATASDTPGGCSSDSPDDAGADVPEEREPDDLGRIEGVTPKIETALQENGITSYEQLATCDEFRLRSILRNAGLRFTPTLTSWPEQAELLAQGDDEGFAELSARVAADHRAAGTA